MAEQGRGENVFLRAALSLAKSAGEARVEGLRLLLEAWVALKDWGLRSRKIHLHLRHGRCRRLELRVEGRGGRVHERLR